MLSVDELKRYAFLKDLSLRDIEAYCDISDDMISKVFNGERNLTKQTHDEIVKGINAASFAKYHKTFKRPKLDKNKNSIKPGKERESNKD